MDNEWRFATDQPTVRDEMGNINNCITVIDQAMYLHEHAASGFFGDTPHNMYTQVLQPLLLWQCPDPPASRTPRLLPAPTLCVASPLLREQACSGPPRCSPAAARPCRTRSR